MTTEELVERLNKNERVIARRKEGKVVVCNDGGNPVVAIDDQATNIFELDWRSCSPYINFSKPSREYITAQIEEYLQTPIEKRRSGKRYLLFWDDDGDGTSNCLAKGPDGWGIVKIDESVPGKLAPKSCEFTEYELDQIKQDHPWLSGAIDSMKVPVKEDD